jgi:hypothetical protein
LSQLAGVSMMASLASMAGRCVLKPATRAFNSPASLVSAKLPTVLGLVLRLPIGRVSAVGCDNYATSFAF